MKKIIYRIFITCLFLLMIMNLIKIGENISKAATYNFNFNGSTSANIGDTLTFTITGNGLTGNVKLSGNNVTLSDNQVWIEKNSVTITAKINGFPASVTAMPDELTDNDYNIVSIASKTITINEKKKEQPSANSGQTGGQGQTGNNNQPSTGNNDQNSNQGQITNSGQNSNQGQNNSQNSNQEQNNGQSNNSGKANNQPSNSNGNINQSNLNEQGNIKSSNNYLKNLEVNIGTLTPEFYRETYEYTINNIIEDDIQVIAEAEDEKAIVNGTGTIALNGGENRINIEVIAENEQTRTYTLVVNKLEDTMESDLRLSNLEIQTINEKNMFEDLDIGFDKDTLEYEVTVEDNITDLSIEPTIDKEGIIIETKGDKNLQEGRNIVTITLTNQNLTNNNINDINNNINNGIDSNAISESNQENAIENNDNFNVISDNGDNSGSISDNDNPNIISENDDNSNIINDNNGGNFNMTNNSTNIIEEGNVKEQTTYIINVNKKAKPITEVSSNGIGNNKFVAGVILFTLITGLLIATIVAYNKKDKTKPKKYKRAK